MNGVLLPLMVLILVNIKVILVRTTEFNGCD